MKSRKIVSAIKADVFLRALRLSFPKYVDIFARSNMPHSPMFILYRKLQGRAEHMPESTFFHHSVRWENEVLCINHSKLLMRHVLIFSSSHQFVRWTSQNHGYCLLEHLSDSYCSSRRCFRNLYCQCCASDALRFSALQIPFSILYWIFRAYML